MVTQSATQLGRATVRRMFGAGRGLGVSMQATLPGFKSGRNPDTSRHPLAATGVEHTLIATGTNECPNPGPTGLCHVAVLGWDPHAIIVTGSLNDFVRHLVITGDSDFGAVTCRPAGSTRSPLDGVPNSSRSSIVANGSTAISGTDADPRPTRKSVGRIGGACADEGE